MNVRSIPCSHLAQSQRLTEEAQFWLKIDAYKYKVMCLGNNRDIPPMKQGERFWQAAALERAEEVRVEKQVSVPQCYNQRNTATTYVAAHWIQKLFTLYLAVMRLPLTHRSPDLGFEALEMQERHSQFVCAVSFAGPLIFLLFPKVCVHCRHLCWQSSCDGALH